MEQLYKRIEINGDVNRLPKEKGGYYFFHGINEAKLQLLCYCQKTEDSEVLPAFYIDKFDFYLLPVTSPENAVILTEEMVNKEYPVDPKEIAIKLKLSEHLTEGAWRSLKKIGEINGQIRLGIKWALSKVQPIDLTKFLKDFNSFMLGYCGDDNIPTIDRCIKDYLDYLHKPEEGK